MRAAPRRFNLAHATAWLLGAALLLFLAVPIILLVVLGGAGIGGALKDPDTIAALETTFVTATVATLMEAE